MMKIMNLLPALLITLIVFFQCGSKSKNDYVVKPDFLQYVESQIQHKFSEVEPMHEEVFLFYNDADKVVYLSEDFQRESLDSVFLEIYNRGGILRVICDPRLDAAEREYYFTIYRMFTEAERTFLNQLSTKKYGKHLDSLSMDQQRYFLMGMPITVITSACDEQYKHWVRHVLFDDKTMREHGIPCVLSHFCAG